jgi:hypothetical protein
MCGESLGNPRFQIGRRDFLARRIGRAWCARAGEPTTFSLARSYPNISKESAVRLNTVHLTFTPLEGKTARENAVTDSVVHDHCRALSFAVNRHINMGTDDSCSGYRCRGYPDQLYPQPRGHATISSGKWKKGKIVGFKKVVAVATCPSLIVNT